MDFSFFRDIWERISEKKSVPVLFGALFVLGAVFGMCFAAAPEVFPYLERGCSRFLAEVCFTDRNVFVIFLERTAGVGLLLALILLSGVHVAALVLPSVLLVGRAYTFGGSLVVFFSAYRVTGALVVFAAYLPVHLLIDLILLAATCLSCGRAPRFCFCKRDLCDLGKDFLFLFAAGALVLFAEMLLLAVIFHPLGDLI